MNKIEKVLAEVPTDTFGNTSEEDIVVITAKKIFEKFDKYACIKNDKWYKEEKKSWKQSTDKERKAKQ